ncbi:MAG: MerR family transcriptional regulator [Roseibium sp.]
MSGRVDIEVPEYTQADVIRITGVSAKTLQNWTDPSRGILKLSQDGVGKGRRRLYSALDIMAVKLIAQLSALGVSPNLVSQLFYDREPKVSEWFKSAVDNSENDHICRIFFDAEGLFARLIASNEDNERYIYETERADERFAFIQVSLTAMAAFVRYGIDEIRFEETPEDQRSEQDKAIRALRTELRKDKKKSKRR